MLDMDLINSAMVRQNSPEQAAFAENAVRYQATLTFLNAKFRGLLTAILGG